MDEAQERIVEPKAAEIAAKATGLRGDQIERAVSAYREAVTGLVDEPQWSSISFVSGKKWGAALYGADDTAVTLQVENWMERGEWKHARCYIYRDKPYEHFAEAKAAELRDSTRYRPYALSSPRHPGRGAGVGG